MSLTQFAMVEELAFLIKDNLPCKHLVLSMEQRLVDFLQDETSLDTVLELEPMNPYNRLLLHRLADIFGFSHQSIGEGEDRHLVLKLCEDTSMPSVLVADMLWEHDECPSPSPSQLLSQQAGVSVGVNVQTSPAQISLEDREAAYLAARKRIFSTGEAEKERPRNNLVVAHRMIAHALGQRINQSSRICTPNNDGVGSSKNIRIAKSDTKKPDIKEEHIGAAKRMFANALRTHAGSQAKQTDK